MLITLSGCTMYHIENYYGTTGRTEILLEARTDQQVKTHGQVDVEGLKVP